MRSTQLVGEEFENATIPVRNTVQVSGNISVYVEEEFMKDF